MYESILVPTDGGQGMAVVVDQATQLASLCGSTVHILHVVDERAYLAVPDDARDRVRDTLQADAESFTTSAASRVREAGLDFVREVRWGDPASAILAYAVENKVDLIVMGTHGRTGFERYLLGSVAETVVRVAPMPVLTIALGDTEQRREEILEGVGGAAFGTDSGAKQAPEEEIDGAPSDTRQQENDG